MQIGKLLLSFAATTAAVLAQGDDCSGALSVSNGVFGPFTNVGSTTSAPAWPCAVGGNDVWFSYVATGTGTLTVDTCGAGYDSALEIFDGTGGCGNLVSLGCNDDSCGLQSSLTVNVNSGTTYYFRVGGFAGQTGTFPLNVAGPGVGNLATVTSYGTGCVRGSDSFYESFASSAAFDLAGNGMTMVFTGTGYMALPALAAYVPPSGGAAVLPLTDDSETTVQLTTPFVYPGGVATALTVCSNGFVSVASGNGTGFSPNVTTFLGGSQTSWRSWHDFNPAIAAGGRVKFEEVGGTAYVTWDGVWDFGGSSAANANTLQFQFDASGSVTILWVTMSGLGNGHLVGYSPGGPSIDPGSVDLSVTLPTGITVGPAILPLALANTGRPIVNTSMNFDTSNIPTSTAFGAILLGFTRFNPPVDLTSLGMPGCFQYNDNLASFLFLPAGSTQATPFSVPNYPGITLQAQSVVYAPAAGLTPLGAISSNGLELLLGTF